MSSQHSVRGWIASLGALVVSASCLGVFPQPLRAQTSPEPPEELLELVTQLEAAANRHDLSAVMAWYGPEFLSADGLSPAQFSQSLEQLWQRYPDLTYQTELVSWEQTEQAWVAETITQITGTETLDGRPLKLTATIRSQQHFANQKLIKQEILSENTQVLSGEEPPEVEFMVPDEVQVGEQFDFDAIARRPLGNDLLLGAALEDPVVSQSYLTPSTLELEILAAGGVFRLVTAPSEPGNHWLSAILVQSQGLNLMTQRIQIQP